MKLISDASHWHKFWSIRLMILSAALGALELVLPVWEGIVPQHTFAILSTVSALGAAIARVIKQEIESSDA